jgi:hypothetical protein
MFSALIPQSENKTPEKPKNLEEYKKISTGWGEESADEDIIEISS